MRECKTERERERNNYGRDKEYWLEYNTLIERERSRLTDTSTTRIG